jgi:hypothetical protein
MKIKICIQENNIRHELTKLVEEVESEKELKMIFWDKTCPKKYLKTL